MSRYAMSKYEETLDAVRRVWESHHDITPQDDDCPKWETVTDPHLVQYVRKRHRACSHVLGQLVPQTEERKEG